MLLEQANQAHPIKFLLQTIQNMFMYPHYILYMDISHYREIQDYQDIIRSLDINFFLIYILFKCVWTAIIVHYCKNKGERNKSICFMVYSLYTRTFGS